MDAAVNATEAEAVESDGDVGMGLGDTIGVMLLGLGDGEIEGIRVRQSSGSVRRSAMASIVSSFVVVSRMRTSSADTTAMTA